MRAIILKKQPTNEYDLLVTCYTEEHGKLMAIAKSALKPNSIQAMHLDVMNLVSFDLVDGRAMPIITGAQAEKTYQGIKSDFKILSVGYFFMEAVNRIAFDYQEDKELWQFLNDTLDNLDKAPQDIKEYLRSSQVKFLNILGYSPNFNECAFCSAKISGKSIIYSAEARGALCQDCFLEGRMGIVIKSEGASGNQDSWLTIPVLGAIFESLAERRIHSLSLVKLC